jgi:two-component system phosphate regulon sensor histidine kinase PhoR
MFWRLFLIYGLLVLASVVLFGLIVLQTAAIMLDPDAGGVLTRAVGVSGLLTFVTALIPAFVLARRFARPLEDLADGARRIAAGDYDHHVYVGTHGESGLLARAFNEMCDKLAVQFAQLKEDREQLRTILGGMVEGVVAIDANQRVLFANERAAHLLGFPADHAVGRKLWEVTRQRPVQEVVEAALRANEPQRQELDGAGSPVKHLALYVARLPSPASGAILVMHDTSDLRRLERIRHEFVANVSHELKTPLSVITSSVEALQDGAVEDADKRGLFLDQIAHESARLHALILDLLSLARIESEAKALDLEPVRLDHAVSDCLDRQRTRAEAKHQQLTALPPDDTAALTAWADEEAVGGILDNLVDNALKYTPAGGKITVRWYGLGPQVFLEVADTGIGIPERDLPRIFERFYRVDKARSREMGGTGLGLAIVKHMSQLMKGGVRAASTLGKGTTFTVSLPRAQDATDPRT